MRTLFLTMLAAVTLLGLAGCERPQVVSYKQGEYQGKKDTPVYDSPQFNNSESDWERAIKARNQKQNEYKRINQGA